jgi:hypothetical protein
MVKAKVEDLGILFGGEPPAANRESRYARLYDALAIRPNEWADVTDAVRVLASATESGKIPSPAASAVTLRNNGFEATTRINEEGDHRVWARFVPEADEADEAPSEG